MLAEKTAPLAVGLDPEKVLSPCSYPKGAGLVLRSVCVGEINVFVAHTCSIAMAPHPSRFYFVTSKETRPPGLQPVAAQLRGSWG